MLRYEKVKQYCETFSTAMDCAISFHRFVIYRERKSRRRKKQVNALSSRKEMKAIPPKLQMKAISPLKEVKTSPSKAKKNMSDHCKIPQKKFSIEIYS